MQQAYPKDPQSMTAPASFLANLRSKHCLWEVFGVVNQAKALSAA